MRWLCLLLALAPAAALARSKSTIVVSSPVDGATVEIDGRVVGKTPLRPQPATPGKHVLKVRRLGYLEFAQEVAVQAGKATQVDADLLPFAGVLEVKSNVRDAQVLVDGKVVGKAPLELEVKLGKHTIKVSAPGYEPHVALVTAEPGNTYAVDAKLAQSGAVDDLALEPLTAKRLSDELALEPLAPEKRLDAPPEESQALMLSAPVEPAKPWYMKPWAWGAAAVVVAGGVTAAVLLSRDDGGTEEKPYDVMWQLGVKQVEP